jgi:SNF family Na+-dependent transporter
MARPINSRVLWIVYDALSVLFATALAFLSWRDGFWGKVWLVLAILHWMIAIFWVVKFIRGSNAKSRGVQPTTLEEYPVVYVRNLRTGWKTWLSLICPLILLLNGLVHAGHLNRDYWEFLVFFLYYDVVVLETRNIRLRERVQSPIPETVRS